MDDHKEIPFKLPEARPQPEAAIAIQKHLDTLAFNHAMKVESAIKQVLVEHYGESILSVPGREALQRVIDDKLVLTKQVDPDMSVEILLYHGPQFAAGEAPDESRIIIRKKVP